MLAALDARGADRTICPSEVARMLAEGGDRGWRDAMPAVHAAVDALAADGAVRLSWRGVPLPVRAGAYRIARR